MPVRMRDFRVRPTGDRLVLCLVEALSAPLVDERRLCRLWARAIDEVAATTQRNASSLSMLFAPTRVILDAPGEVGTF